MPKWQAGRHALACLALLFAVGAAHAASKVVITSPAGETLGGGVGTRTYATPTADISAWADQGSVVVQVHQGAKYFDINLRMPHDLEVLPGLYGAAELAHKATGLAPGIDVGSDLGNCNDAWGNFRIRQFERGALPGEVARLEATFTMRCDSASAQALTGTIYIEAGPRYFSFSRDAGFPLGTVASRSYYGDNSEPHADGSRTDGLVVAASGQRDDWWFGFQPPVGKQFAKGTYALADSADATHAGLIAVDNHGGQCEQVAGSLVVRNIAYDAGGQLAGIHATWTLTCDGQPAALRGTIHFDL